MAENSNSLPVWQQTLTLLGRCCLFLLFRDIQGGFINVLSQEHRGIIVLPLFLRRMAFETLVFYCTWSGCLGVFCALQGAIVCEIVSELYNYINNNNIYVYVCMHVCIYLLVGNVCRRQD